MRKNRFSPERRQARQALVELLNIPHIDFYRSEDDPRGARAFERAKMFIERYGPLRRQRPRRPNEAEVFEYQAEVVEYARRFRHVWTEAKKREFRSAEATLNQILTEGDTVKGLSPALTADIEAGAIRQKARTLLQQLALEFLYSRRALRRCPVCRDFFLVEGGSRQMYCKNRLRDCAHESRNRSQKLLMRKRREKPEENK